MDEIVNSTDTSKTNYYILGSSVILVNLLNIIVIHFYHLRSQRLGMKIRIACSSLIYKKSLKLSKRGESESKMGKIVNLLSNDVYRFDLAPMHLTNLLVAPLETFFVIFSLYATVGTTAISGIVFLGLFMPLQSKFKYREGLLKNFPTIFVSSFNYSQTVVIRTNNKNVFIIL